MSKKVLIMGAGAGKLATLKFKESFGEDVEIYTVDEAQKAGLGPKDFDNLPTYAITAPKIYDTPILGVAKSGQELRREKRKNKKKNKHGK